MPVDKGDVAALKHKSERLGVHFNDVSVGQLMIMVQADCALVKVAFTV